MKNKRGSFAVFLSLVFCAILILLLTVLKVSADFAISSSIDSVGNLFGRSILSEFDLALKERYGIIACDLNEYSFEEKLNFYFSQSIDDKKYIDLQEITSNFDDYSLNDGNVFLSEVDKIVLSNVEPNIWFNELNEDNHNKYISSDWIINSLPSRNKIVEIDSSLIDKIAIEKYLFSYFKNYKSEKDLGKTYFNNEIEYIISGKLNDSDSLHNVYNKILAIRNADNLRYIESSKEKSTAIDALSVLIMPESPLIFKALFSEAWAYLESKNDLKLLYAGKKVPLLKDDESFALDLDMVKNAILKDGKEKESLEDFDYDNDYSINVVEPMVIKGENYEGYLKILLSTMSLENIAYRALDLIQINLKYIYSNDFLVSDYVVGVNYMVKVNNKRYYFKSKY